ncbi:MAG: tetratricopeptide repeat protein [Pseudobdellovibrio sp.]
MIKIKYITFCILAFSFFAKAETEDTSLKAKIDSVSRLIHAGDHLQASQQLLAILNDLNVPTAKPRLKYLLGLSLMELNLNQTAAFQFVDVVRSGDANWTQPAIEKLLIVTDKLGDETLLNFAIQRVEISQFPLKNRELLYFRLADIKHKSGFTEEAIQYYKKVTPQSRFYYNALYNMGLAQDELGRTDEALASFKKLLASRASAKANDTNKVSALMGIARTYYQQKEWSKSIEMYAKIPRDHPLWHTALFEKTWAMLRSGRFRSTLSNFQTLHSTYYEDAYLPETLVLRAIVYLYICQYDEMEKVLSLFDNQYGPALKKVTAFNDKATPAEFYQQFYEAMQLKTGHEAKRQLEVPYNILKYVAAEGDVRRAYYYLKKINEEKKSIDENNQLKRSSIGEYANRILTNRIASTKLSIGGLVKKHLADIKTELSDLTEQAGFVRYEMINGRKELLKRRMEGKIAKVAAAKSEENDREFYIKNGYEYYPFQGEYWLDEVGNYHYLGKQSCE